MLTLPPNVSVLLHRAPVDIRKSFDGLLGIIRSVLHADPLTPTFFLFFNKGRNKLKILYWDNDGFVIWYKRLEKAGRLQVCFCTQMTQIIKIYADKK